jgi:hypothetical protein
MSTEIVIKKKMSAKDKYDAALQYVLDNKDLSKEELTKKASKMVPIGSSFRPKKVQKDGPKRSKNAYMFFCEDARSKSKKTLLAKDLGAKWEKLSTKEKEKYLKLAEADKARYNSEVNKAEPQEKQLKNKDDPNYILNEKSGKMVLRTGAIGKKILEELGEHKGAEKEEVEVETEDDSSSDDEDEE